MACHITEGTVNNGKAGVLRWRNKRRWLNDEWQWPGRNLINYVELHWNCVIRNTQKEMRLRWELWEWHLHKNAPEMVLALLNSLKKRVPTN